MASFETLNVSQPVLRALADLGFENATPIQEAAIPVVADGRDMIGQAQTGTGKTAAFAIPLVMAAADAGETCLVLAPTRELAQQVAKEVDAIGKHANVRALALYGGTAFGPQARDLGRGKHQILVATPGRLRDHISRGTLDPGIIRRVVLDEADEMLNMGFLEEVEEILEAIDGAGATRQTLLFSATMPDAIRRLANRHLENPEHVAVAGEGDSVATDNTKQLAVRVRNREKLDALLRILAVERPTGALVFRHTREMVDELVDTLRSRGVAAEALHGGKAQAARDDVVGRLRDGRARVLVATNVAARGLDVDNLSHVINYDTPKETEAYVHRIGRTGRAGRSGRSFLFVTPRDRRRLRDIERTVGSRLDWYDVPTDDEVDAAVTQNLTEWIQTESEREDGMERHLAAVDAALENGADARQLAAAALRSAARHEGLGRPPLDAQRTENDRQHPASDNRAPSDAPAQAIALNVGRHDGVRPGDIVGALTNEGGLVGAEVGRIQILARMAVAEVPGDKVDQLHDTMADAVIRNRPVNIRVAEGWDFRGPPNRGNGKPRRQPRRPAHADAR